MQEGPLREFVLEEHLWKLESDHSKHFFLAMTYLNFF